MWSSLGLRLILVTLASASSACGSGSGSKTLNGTGGEGGTTGTGGTTGAGGATSAGDATSAGGVSGTGGATSSTGSSPGGGYFVSGDWHGYVGTGDWPAGSTISPSDFSTQTTSFPFCATGTAAGASSSSGGGMINFPVNQAQGVNTPAETWQPATLATGGVLVNMSNPGNALSTYVVIYGLNGATDANDRWCARVGAFNQDVQLPWTIFNTTCWNNQGSFYAGQPLQYVAPQVDSGAVIAYSFCVNSIKYLSVTNTLCAVPSTLGLARTTGGLFCTADAGCAPSYPYLCSQTKTCYGTEVAAAAACGSTPCETCVATTCQCDCSCQPPGDGPHPVGLCQPEYNSNGAITCCAELCAGPYPGASTMATCSLKCNRSR